MCKASAWYNKAIQTPIFSMSAINTFVQKFSSDYAAKRIEISSSLALEKERILDEYSQKINHVAALEERYTALVAPLVGGLSAFPDNVVINQITFNENATPNVDITVKPGVSMASLLMDYPAIPFVIGANGALTKPSVDTDDEVVFSGILVSTKMQLAQWQTTLNGQQVNITCKMNGLTQDVWNNPANTGAPVVTMQVGDIGGSTAWRSLTSDGVEYWAQPASPVALDNLYSAKQWRAQAQLSAEIREEFNSRLMELPALQSPQARIVVNALFTWARSGQELPVKEDFSAWKAPRGNVLVMHSAQDWANLVSDAPQERGIKNPAQAKIHILSERLPNIWRFTDEAGIGVLCDAMAEVQTRLQVNPSLSI